MPIEIGSSCSGTAPSPECAHSRLGSIDLVSIEYLTEMGDRVEQEEEQEEEEGVLPAMK